MPRFPLYEKPLRDCCDFHRNEPQKGGSCETPQFASISVYGRYLLYELDFKRMTAAYVKEILWEGGGWYLVKTIGCEHYGEGELVAKCHGYTFGIIAEYHDIRAALPV